ncbi:MAG: SurA N-terminal domain-containing protein [Pseudobdellovibrionaceae bacterium]
MFDTLKKQIENGRLSFKSVVAVILFGAIILVFVLFGLPTAQLGTGGAVAEVNGVFISAADFQKELQRQEQMYSFLLQQGGAAQRQMLRQGVINDLVQKELEGQLAQKSGILGTDAELKDVLMTQIPQFQRDGRFNREQYLNLLTANSLNPADFEKNIRKDVARQRSRRVMAIAAHPTQMELAKAAALNGVKINVQFAQVDKSEMIQKQSITEAAAQAAMGQPEFLKKMEEYFNANKADFSSDEQVKAQHILISAAKGDAASEDKAKAKIKEIQKKLQSEDFGKVASQFSEDPGSKSKGGDLGYFEKGQMVPEFSEAAFSQPVGAVGEPIQSQFGFHIIKVTDKKAAVTASFESQKTLVAQKVLAQEKVEAGIEALNAALGAQSDAQVEAALKGMGLKWEETGLFDMNVAVAPKLGSKVATDAAWGLSEQKKMSSQLVRDGLVQFALRLKERKTENPATPDLKLTLTLSQQKASEMYRSLMEQKQKESKIQINQQWVSQQ